MPLHLLIKRYCVYIYIFCNKRIDLVTYIYLVPEYPKKIVKLRTKSLLFRIRMIRSAEICPSFHPDNI